MVASIDGKTTKGDIGDPTVWNSKEDRSLFSHKIINASLIIMGRKTYEQSRSLIRSSLKPETLRIIMTRSPEKFQAEKVQNQLEFTDEDPSTLIERLEDEKCSDALLVGGANLNSNFFKANLVNELWLTIEPKLFGVGNGIIGEKETEISLELIESKKLNEKGTLLLKYKVTN